MRNVLSRSGALCALLLALGGTAQADEALFKQNCSSCHGEQAEGIPGLAPPLAHAQLWQGLGDNAVAYITGVMANGMSGQLTAQGQMYIGLVMPPQRHQAPEDLASVANHVLQLNGVSARVSAADVEQARAASLGHAELRSLRPKNL